MSILLQNLSKESILLMYLAGELPDEDRIEVEQMLAGDASLRAELEQLRADYEGVGSAIATADESARFALPAGAAARRVGQTVRSWHAKRLSQPPVEAEQRRLRFPVWAYGLATAAVLLIMYTGWWGIRQERGLGGDRIAGTQPFGKSVGEDDSDASTGIADSATESPSPSGDQYASDAWDGSVLRDVADSRLDALEEDVLALSTDNDSSIILTGETDER